MRCIIPGHGARGTGPGARGPAQRAAHSAQRTAHSARGTGHGAPSLYVLGGIGLQLIEAVIVAAQRNELSVRALLENASVAEHDDAAGPAERR